MSGLSGWDYWVNSAGSALWSQVKNRVCDHEGVTGGVVGIWIASEQGKSVLQFEYSEPRHHDKIPRTRALDNRASFANRPQTQALGPQCTFPPQCLDGCRQSVYVTLFCCCCCCFVLRMSPPCLATQSSFNYNKSVGAYALSSNCPNLYSILCWLLRLNFMGEIECV